MSNASLIMRILLGGPLVAASLFGCASVEPDWTRLYTSASAINSLVVGAEAAERGEYSAVPKGGWSKTLDDAATWLDEHYQEYPDDVAALILRARLGRLQRMLEPVIFTRGVDPPTQEQFAEEYAPLHAWLERALALEPENPEAHYWKARLYGVRHPIVQGDNFEYVFDDLEEALRFAGKAVRLSPSNVKYREALALFLVWDAQVDAAIAVMRDVDDGRHPILLLLTDLQAVPTPERAVFSAKETEGFTQMQMELGRIRDYPALRIHVYYVPLTVEEVEAFYRESWPDFRFFVMDQEDEERSSVRTYTQVLRWKDGILRPATTRDQIPLDRNATDGITLALVALSGPNAAERERVSTAIDGVERTLFILNYREPDSH